MLKTKSKSRSKPSDKHQIHLAREVQTLSSLLWRKALAEASPKVRVLLLAYARARHVVDSVLPEEIDRWPFSVDNIVKALQEAEDLLTSKCPGNQE